MDTKNIFHKLQEARLMLSEKDLKKSGHNKFSNYHYFELADFMPSVIEIFKEMGLTGLISFNPDSATLTIINADKPDESIVFNSPVAGVDLKGMHAIQNLGAVQTYMRRYLYMAAMDITEPDALDAGGKVEEPKKVEPTAEKQAETKKEYPPDDRPWINATQVKSAIAKIEAGEEGIPAKCKELYKISKDNWSKIAAAAPKARVEDVEITEDLPF